MTKPERLFESQLYDAMSGEWYRIHAEACQNVRGIYYIIVNDDPEHSFNTSSVGLENAKADVEEVVFQLSDYLDIPQFVTYNAAGKNS
jgi:hypothetical protein